MEQSYFKAARDCRERMTEFCREIIRIPSISGQEEQCAIRVAGEMKDLGYDEVTLDGAGNVIGLVRGAGKGRSIMLNTHLDQVHPGDQSSWAHPPFEAILENGIIYGRGASDTKGAMAVQVYAPFVLKQIGLRPRCDVYVTAVVLEEVGGYGARHLIEKDDLHPALCISGEPTSNELALGHRGRAELVVRAAGRAAHASVPEKGDNPHYHMARFLLELERETRSLPSNALLGKSSIAPTLYTTSSLSHNAISDFCELVLDWRFTTESEDEMLALVRRCIAGSKAVASVDFARQETATYTGISEVRRHIAGAFTTPPDHPFVTALDAVIARTRGRAMQEPGFWRFATDGAYFSGVAGIPTIGFSPCEERFAHTVDDQVSVDMMEESLACYAAILEDGLGL